MLSVPDSVTAETDSDNHNALCSERRTAVKGYIRTAAALAAAVVCFAQAPPASARRTSDAYNYDRWGEAIPSQSGYTALRSVSGSDLGTSAFSGLSDICLCDGKFYIADAGNNRIVIADEKLESITAELTEFDYRGEKLSIGNPGGVYASEEGLVYIADTGNSRIIRCDEEGNTDLVITRPVSEQYTAVTFMPKRVLCDRAGFIYVADENVTSGAVMFDPEGNFRGYYGANRVEQTGEVLRNYFWKFLANDEMRRYMTNSVPAAVSSFDTDDSGFIYTCSSSLSQDVDKIKKVNAAGYNLFADLDTHFGDMPSADYSDYPQNSYVDIDVSPSGLINCLDYTNGRIFQYDEDCNLLFIFGEKGYQLGTFRQVSAIESTDEQVFVADSQKNTITVFGETKFGETVHRATALYNAGYYEEALEPWFEVLRRDGNYRRAYMGIASAYINQGNYADAMKYAKIADSQWRYDRAFEGWRERWISRNFIPAALVLLLAAAAAAVLKKIFRNRKLRSSAPEAVTAAAAEVTEEGADDK